jgi:quinol monooxygenase YgiN
MIVTTTKVTVASSNKRELFQTVWSLRERLEKVRGCLSARLYLEVGDENSYVLMEEWASREDWNRHLQSEEFAVLLGAIRVLSSSRFDFKLLAPTDGIEAITNARLQPGS